MPREMRRLILDDSEFNEAIRVFVESREQMFHGATLVSSRISSEDPLEAELTVLTQSRQQSTVKLTAAHLAAAVIAYCFAYRIPLPRSSDKSVKRVPGGIALDIMMGKK